MANVQLVDELLTSAGPLNRAFRLALSQANLDQKTVAAVFCYIVGAHFAEEFQSEVKVGEATEESVRREANSLLSHCGLFVGDVTHAVDYIWTVTRHLILQGRVPVSSSPEASDTSLQDASD
jgi:hypothetical protein